MQLQGYVAFLFLAAIRFCAVLTKADKALHVATKKLLRQYKNTAGYIQFSPRSGPRTYRRKRGTPALLLKAERRFPPRLPDREILTAASKPSGKPLDRGSEKSATLDKPTVGGMVRDNHRVFCEILHERIDRWGSG
jgi:hypothetical protein